MLFQPISYVDYTVIRQIVLKLFYSCKIVIIRNGIITNYFNFMYFRNQNGLVTVVTKTSIKNRNYEVTLERGVERTANF